MIISKDIYKIGCKNIYACNHENVSNCKVTGIFCLKKAVEHKKSIEFLFYIKAFNSIIIN